MAEPMTDTHHKPDPQTLAEKVRDRMYEHDAASRGLGIAIEVIAPGYARATMTVRPDMVNKSLTPGAKINLILFGTA